jgi:hypothetical protein
MRHDLLEFGGAKNIGREKMSIAERALSRGRELTFSEADIEAMVYRGARYSHPIGNVRFMDFWFLVEKGDVLLMGKLGPKSAGVKMSFPDAIDCTVCRGTMLIATVDAGGNEELVSCQRMEDRELPLCSQF